MLWRKSSNGSLATVVEGYKDLHTIEAVEARKSETIDQLSNIQETVAFMKEALLSNELNPGAIAQCPSLVQAIMLERQGQQPKS